MKRLRAIDEMAILAYQQIQYQIQAQRIANKTGLTIDQVLDKINQISNNMNKVISKEV